MDFLHFAFQFFHFNCSQWNEYNHQQQLTETDMAQLFESGRFAFRHLKIGGSFTFMEAQRHYEQIKEFEQKTGIQSIPFYSSKYPQVINKYISPSQRPVFINVRGGSELQEEKNVGIVGTRMPSVLGKNSAEIFTKYFCSLGLTIVSGLAYGIDTVAHQTSLPGRTVAVLGSGFSEIYPEINTNLANSILEHQGLLISPFAILESPMPYNFPKRNAIIAALSAGILVVEGSEKSGAAITGKLALEMGKSVVTLSQDYRTAYGRGAIRLTESGATMVATEQEALQVIFARFGGFSTKDSSSLTKSFSIDELRQSQQLSFPQAVQIIETAKHAGLIKKGLDGRWAKNSIKRDS